MVDEQTEALIVGGGIAGITCALELQKAGVPYTMVTEDVGGRICYLRQYQMNFGAVFFMQGYHHARQVLTPTTPVLPSYFDLECHLSLGRGYGIASKEMLSAAPQLLLFLGYLKNTFGPAYAAFMKTCETREFGEAVSEHPYIGELFVTSAADFIAENGFGRAARVLVSQFVYACTGTQIRLLNALDYLVCAMGIIDTAMRFTFDADAMRARLSEGAGDVRIDSVVALGQEGGLWVVETQGGRKLSARSLVMATPANVTRGLLEPITGTYEIRNASKLHAFKVSGRIKDAYAHHKLHLFDQSIPLINIGARPDGAYEVFTCEDLDMGIFFDDYRIEHRKDWPYALFTNPSLLLRQDMGEGLYRIGDHNALGLEPAAISGVFAANAIKERHHG